MSCPDCRQLESLHLEARAESAAERARAERERHRAERFECLATHAKAEAMSAQTRALHLTEALQGTEGELRLLRDALSLTALRRDDSGTPCWCELEGGMVDGVRALPHEAACRLARRALRVAAT